MSNINEFPLRSNMKHFVKKLNRVCGRLESVHGFIVIMRVGVCIAD